MLSLPGKPVGGLIGAAGVAVARGEAAAVDRIAVGLTRPEPPTGVLAFTGVAVVSGLAAAVVAEAVPATVGVAAGAVGVSLAVGKTSATSVLDWPQAINIKLKTSRLTTGKPVWESLRAIYATYLFDLLSFILLLAE
jgi:uncharacterized protein with beta-barrel porin domain